MKIGILQTGVPPLDLGAQFGDYAAMIRTLLGNGFQADTFDVVADGPPESIEGYAGFVITGSPAGVYDDLPWIAPLSGFLNDVRGRTKLVGICFGHQIMAQAFGGQVVKSPKGWGVGLQRYEVAQRQPWMDDAAEIAIPASHQDQVVTPPADAEVILSSSFAPFAGLAYPDSGAMSFQGHPEFDPTFATSLIEARRGVRLDHAMADAAVASLAQPNDRARVGGWIQRFLVG